MNDHLTFIEKNPDKPFGQDFKKLKEAGLTYIQELSGEFWTDYNNHDPGITILEQLCYALTEVCYQYDLNLKDLLPPPGNRHPDYEKLGLALPHEVYSIHPLQPVDYSRVIYDSVEGVANAWLKPHADTRGLYTMYLDIIDKEIYGLEAERQRIRLEASEAFHRNRNLGEDLADVVLLKYKIIDVEAEIDIDSERDAHEVLGDILLNLQQCLAPRIRYHSLDELLDAGYSYGEIFSGPRLWGGIIPAHTCKPKPDVVNVQIMANAISGLPDVDAVRALMFYFDGEPLQEIRVEENEILWFRFDPLKVVRSLGLYHKESGRQLRINTRHLKRYYHNRRGDLRKRYRHEDQHRMPETASELIGELGRYSSIQDDFPTIYGINRYGVPTGASKERKAKVRQLKAYLMLFEQHLVTAIALPADMRNLFSLDTDLHTYPFRLLDDDTIHRASELYAGEDMEETHRRFAELNSRFDQPYDRKIRAVDYLISLYGDSCPMEAFTQFNYYYHDEELPKRILESKITFLKQITKFHHNRSGAFDYTNIYDPWNNSSAIRARIRSFLGLNRRAISLIERSCRTIFDNYEIDLVSTTRLRKPDCYKVDEQNENYLTITYSDSIAEVYFDKVDFLEAKSLPQSKFRTIIRESSIFKEKLVDDELLKCGVELANYRIGRSTRDGSFIVVVKSVYQGEQVWRRIGVTSGKIEACDLVLAWQLFCRELSMESEDLHIVEHILLRPFTDITQDFEYKITEEFYTSRITILLPNWTVRFSNPSFRILMTELLTEWLPAHLYAENFWLSPEQMCGFEKLYNDWLAMKSNENADLRQLDRLSYDLTRFIQNLYENRTPDAK